MRSLLDEFSSLVLDSSLYKHTYVLYCIIVLPDEMVSRGGKPNANLKQVTLNYKLLLFYHSVMRTLSSDLSSSFA